MDSPSTWTIVLWGDPKHVLCFHRREECTHKYLFLLLLKASARQAADAPPCNYTAFLSIISQNTTEQLAEKPSKSSPSRSQNDAGSMKNILGRMVVPKRDFFGWGVGGVGVGRGAQARGSAAETQGLFWERAKAQNKSKQCNQTVYLK